MFNSTYNCGVTGSPLFLTVRWQCLTLLITVGWQDCFHTEVSTDGVTDSCLCLTVGFQYHLCVTVGWQTGSPLCLAVEWQDCLHVSLYDDEIISKCNCGVTGSPLWQTVGWHNRIWVCAVKYLDDMSVGWQDHMSLTVGWHDHNNCGVSGSH